MKKKLLYLSLVLAFTFIAKNVNAQLLIEENFEYTSGDPLIAGAVDDSDNSGTSTTGWLTVKKSNYSAGTNSFAIADNGLSYLNYKGSGVGKAVTFLDNNGQDVYKTFCSSNTGGDAFTGPTTIYISYMINVPEGDKSGSDYFAGLKYNPSSTDVSFFGRMYAKVTGSVVNFAILKSSSTEVPTEWSSDYAVGTTHLLVLKYTLGGLYGTTAVEEEAGFYDDKLDLFINPEVGTSEPTTPTLHYENPLDKDAYRYSSKNVIIGGLASLYLRTPAVGSIPASTIDGIRIGYTWNDIVADSRLSNLQYSKSNDFKYTVENKNLNLSLSTNNYTKYDILSISGISMKSGNLHSNTESIDVSLLNKGVYLLNLNGAKRATVKLVIP